MLLKISKSKVMNIVIFLAENIDDATLKAIDKWRNHPSIPAIASEYKNKENF